MGCFPRILNLPLGDVFRLDAGFFVSAAFERLFFLEISMISISPNARQWCKAVALGSMLGVAQFAMAAGGLSGVESGLKEFFTSFYGICAIIAGFTILFVMVQGFSGRGHWPDLIERGAWVIGAAAAGAIVKALWDWGKSVSF